MASQQSKYLPSLIISQYQRGGKKMLSKAEDTIGLLSAIASV